MIVEERMPRMLQIAQRRPQVPSDPRARLLSHTDAAALVICSDNRRTGQRGIPRNAAHQRADVLAGHMGDISVAARRHVGLAWIGLGIGNELKNRLGGNRWVCLHYQSF
jgi:hypothetical protein